MLSRLFTSRKIFVCLLAMGVTTLLGACGGGGGGDPYPNMNYTGVNTEAVIDQTNAADFPFVALEGGSSSGDVFVNLPVGVSNDPSADGGIPDPENIKIAANIISDLIKNQMGNGAQVSGASQSIKGNCVGSEGSAILSGNETSSKITASLQMDNFCVYDSVSGITVKMHGLMNITILYYGDYIFTDFTMSIRYLKMTVSDGVTTVSEEFAGTIEITGIDPGPPTFSVSVNFKYEGKIFKIVNLAIVEDMSTIPPSISVSGKLYHPVHGYVNISTDAADPFVFDDATEQFCNGTLEITSVDTSANIATILFNDPDSNCSMYNICIDANGSILCSDFNPWGAGPVNPWYAPIPTTPTP